MKKLRKCESTDFYTGVSKCPPDFGYMKGAILVEPGTKLPATLSADSLEELVHEDRPSRVYGIVTFCEFSKEGGDVETSAIGYGPEQPNGVSARKDTWTLDKFHADLLRSFTKSMNKKWDAYFFDEDNILYGLDDGTDVLAGYPMSSVYANATPHKTSSEKATMTVTFCHKNAKDAFERFDYIQLDFDPQTIVLGLTPVKLAKMDTGSGYKLYEVTGGNDLTSEYGPIIATAGKDVILGTSVTAVTYNDASDTLTISTTGTDGVRLATPKVLYEQGIKGIVCV